MSGIINENENPLAEVFGFLPSDRSVQARRFQKNKLCPYNNKVPNCTKDKANDPLGVCSINHRGGPVITCPIRFRQDWLIAEDAAGFFFSKDQKWTSLAEVRLTDRDDKSAGNIDIVLASYDDKGQITGFGSIEVQAVYISGNVRRPFEAFTNNPENWESVDWKKEAGSSLYPTPDYLSSSRKRLIPQMLYKGGILNYWQIKQAIAVQKSFFDTLPDLPRVKKEDASIAWFLYELRLQNGRYVLENDETVYTEYFPALNVVTTPIPGNKADFVNHLQSKLDKKFDNPPDTRTIMEIPFNED